MTIDPALAEALTTVGLLTLGGVVLVPRAVVCVGAGAALGWAAVGPAMIGTAAGATLGFVLARFVLQGVIQRFAARRPRVATVMRTIDAEGWTLLALLRLGSPIPGPVINFACGVTRIGYPVYLCTTLAAVLPQTLLFVYLGLAGSQALASRSLFSLNTLMGAVGIGLTLLALWRLKVAARRQTDRMLIAAGAPSA